MSVSKPRSMSAGLRNVLRPNDSASLWNYTLSPGWTREESEILRKALIHFGIGNWKDILESGCLPGKTNAQLNLQTQRLLGQQSTAEFALLHIDPVTIGAINSQKTGDHIRRKNGFIINTGAKLSRDERLKRIQENKKYELPESVWKSVVFARNENKPFGNNEVPLTIKDKINKLEILRVELDQINEWISSKSTSCDA